MIAQTRLIRAKRPNPVRALISLGALALAGTMFLSSPDVVMRAMSWGAIGLAVILAIRLAIRIGFAPDLELSPEGFQVKGLRAPGHVRWTEVARFGQADMRRASFVIYSLKTRPFGAGKRPARLRGLPPEADGYLAHGPEMSVAEQLALMQDWKARYGG